MRGKQPHQNREEADTGKNQPASDFRSRDMPFGGIEFEVVASRPGAQVKQEDHKAQRNETDAIDRKDAIEILNGADLGADLESVAPAPVPVTVPEHEKQRTGKAESRDPVHCNPELIVRRGNRIDRYDEQGEGNANAAPVKVSVRVMSMPRSLKPLLAGRLSKLSPPEMDT